MAFGDYARLEDYDPNATFPPGSPEDEAQWARERAQQRLGNTRRQQADGVERSARLMEPIENFVRAVADPIVNEMTDYSRSRVAQPGPMTEEEAWRINNTGIGRVVPEMLSLLSLRNPLGKVSQAELRGGTLYAGGAARPSPAPIGAALSPIKQGYLSPADQALFAERYPLAGSFELKVDKNKTPPKVFESKVWSPEEQRLAAAREKVMADMKNEPWTPYFDPAKRYDVNLKDYEKLFGKPEDTRALRMSGPATGPKGPNAPQKHLDIATGPAAQDALASAYETGQKLPGTQGFYKMGQLEKEFVDELGKDAGQRQFVRMFTEPMAATTGGSTPTSNLIQSGFANFMREKGLPLPLEKAADIPYPVGGSKYGARQNLQQYDKMLNPGGTGIAHTEHPKRYDFDWSFRGRRDAPVIDEQMMGLMTKGDKAVPPSGGYGLYSEGVHQATKGKVDPIEYQEVGWGGYKHQKEVAELMKKGRSKEEAEAMAFAGQPMITDVNEVIERTSRLLQIPPQEVVRRGLVRGKLPTYGIGGAAVLGGLSDQDSYKP